MISKNYLSLAFPLYCPFFHWAPQKYSSTSAYPAIKQLEQHSLSSYYFTVGEPFLGWYRIGDFIARTLHTLDVPAQVVRVSLLGNHHIHNKNFKYFPFTLLLWMFCQEINAEVNEAEPLTSHNKDWRHLTSRCFACFNYYDRLTDLWELLDSYTFLRCTYLISTCFYSCDFFIHFSQKHPVYSISKISPTNALLSKQKHYFFLWIKAHPA